MVSHGWLHISSQDEDDDAQAVANRQAAAARRAALDAAQAAVRLKTIVFLNYFCRANKHVL